ncbi:hypothetical protein GQ53DRAFT_825823 [Thozetella sp. PMI_491]|nr:hypothetical protein GQ53DRAFT_825823 [Thozetella sp. PMI_491]
MATVPVQTSSYNLEETVSVISSFYDFLFRMHAGEQVESLEYPPPGGWPTITYEDFRKMGYNDTTIALMRQLPYFSNPEYGCCIMENTWPYDWASHRLQVDFDKMDAIETNNGHFFCLTRCEEYGYNVYCDTNRGAIVWTKQDGNFPATALWGDLDDDDDDDEDLDLSDWQNFEWKGVRVFRIKTFFDINAKIPKVESSRPPYDILPSQW